VGIVWKGNPDFLSTVLRDFDPRLLPALTNLPGIEFLSLQYGEAIPANCPQLLPVPLGGDWDETARVLTTLDAVVSVDTSVAHLTGALGLPGYVLLPHAPDWRWGLTGDRTPWYPSLTLIRQPAPHDWAGAIQHLHACLQQTLSTA
jgi:ADP-heptose:LPS heptosyltransferase